MPRLRRTRIRQLVRQFKENGMKMMLEHPANVRDLLGLLDAPWLRRIDFHRLEWIKTTFIRRDYRHLESDVVLTAPLAGRGRSRRKLLIYILIEHQSEPDRLMPLRLADAQVQIFRYQVRQWSQAGRSPARLRVSPVLPVVFYTGLRRWTQVGTLADVIESGDEFRALTPIVESPLFLNLPELPPAKLQREGGYFGWLLQLVQQRNARRGEFEQLLERVISHLETMAPAERQRWRDLLSYIGAMVYHERREPEQQELHKAIERSVESDQLRQEISEMGKSMADVLIERGRIEGRTEGLAEGRTEGLAEGRTEGLQLALVRLLRRRFGDVPAEIVAAVESTTEADQLDHWLDRAVTADTLDELRIRPARRKRPRG